MEVPDEQGELLDELYADAAAPAHEVSGRSVARVLEVAALIVFIGGDRAPRVPVQPGRRRRRSDGDRRTASRPIQPTTTDPTTTTTEGSTTTTQLPVTVKINITACTQKGEALVASGRVEGAPESADGYRITVRGAPRRPHLRQEDRDRRPRRQRARAGATGPPRSRSTAMRWGRGPSARSRRAASAWCESRVTRPRSVAPNGGPDHLMWFPGLPMGMIGAPVRR